ncbi:mRNA-decapping enzyme 1A-like [Sycon ciliatum]|uniref:mRNA-decapping enzyme 1A-like n=1 Tax=Sycon ciliatum TaxID=27933 RepID=UPI0031F679D2
MASGQEGKKKKKQQQQRQAQATNTSNETKKEEADSQINLQAVLRLDPSALNICHVVPQVTLYEFQSSQWVKVDVEGTLFVYRRKGIPVHHLLLMNQLNTRNVTEPITARLNLQIASNFLLYRSSANDAIFGLWVSDSDEQHALGNVIQQLMDESEKTLAKAQEGAASSQQHQPPATTASTTEGKVNVLALLNEAARNSQGAQPAVSTAAALPETPTRPSKSSGSAKPSVTPVSMPRGSQKATGAQQFASGSPAVAMAAASANVVPMISSPFATQLPMPSQVGMTENTPVLQQQQAPVAVLPHSRTTPAQAMQTAFNSMMQGEGRAPPTMAMSTACASVTTTLPSSNHQPRVPVVPAATAVAQLNGGVASSTVPVLPYGVTNATTVMATLPNHHHHQQQPVAVAPASALPVTGYSHVNAAPVSTVVDLTNSLSGSPPLSTAISTPLPYAVASASATPLSANVHAVRQVSQPFVAGSAAPSPQLGSTVGVKSVPNSATRNMTVSMSSKSDLMLPGDFQSSPSAEPQPAPHFTGSPPLRVVSAESRSSRAASLGAVSLPSSATPAPFQRAPSPPLQDSLQGLTLEQMQQGLVHLIKHNPQFMHTLHGAYLESLNPRANSH